MPVFIRICIFVLRMIAIATDLIVYNQVSKLKYVAEEETMAEELKNGNPAAMAIIPNINATPRIS